MSALDEPEGDEGIRRNFHQTSVLCDEWRPLIELIAPQARALACLGICCCLDGLPESMAEEEVPVEVHPAGDVGWVDILGARAAVDLQHSRRRCVRRHRVD